VRHFKWRDNEFLCLLRLYTSQKKEFMPKLIPQDELNASLQAVKHSSTGSSAEEIIQHLGLNLPLRTLQRRLAHLVTTGLLQVTGSKRNRRYHIALAQQRNEIEGILLSPESADIKRYLQQAIQNRPRVGYRQEFLNEYRPNETAYLSDNIRKHLTEIGTPLSSERPAGTYAREILTRLLIDLSWNSSRLEGNTYSLLETEQLVVEGKKAEGKSNFEMQMILNHKAAIEFLVDAVDEIGFNRYTILNLHGLLSDNLLGNPEACGRLRKISVGIGGSSFYPLGVPQRIEECFQQILDIARLIRDPFEQAFFVMVHLPYLQPFEDVNKRVSRLAANIPLIKHNLCPLSFIDVPEHAYVEGVLGIYELNKIDLMRDLFVWSYERSTIRYSSVQQTLGEPDSFKLRYRLQVIDLISQIIKQAMDKKFAISFIQQWAALNVAKHDQMHFVNVVETELLGLHEGNIARYRIRPSEFIAWQKNWQSI
jgi:Fic family protein